MSDAATIIRNARLRSGLSQREVAIRAGTSQAAISRLERGLEEPTVERLEQILAGMGWRPAIALEPLAEHDAEPRRLRQFERLAPDERLERALGWMDLAREVRDGARGRTA